MLRSIATKKIRYLAGVRWKSTGESKVLAIRREDNSVWERRAPLSPNQVSQLVKEGVKVIVQPSNRRAFALQEYENRGAIVQEDISDAPVIIGVKTVPIENLIPNKTYVFFSHTIKAQEANMPLLDDILNKNIRLIDYEKMMNSEGRRMVAFGKYAGVAGMINILHGLGLRLLALGHHTPFMHIGPPHNYRSSYVAQAAIRDAGYEIALGLMPKSIGPLTFVFTGTGNVSQGAQEILRNLPHEYVSVEHLPKVAKHGSLNKVYACVVDKEDNLVRKLDGGYDADEFNQFPEKYASTFSQKIAPYASVIVNGIYYAPGAPRLITIPDAKTLLRHQPTPYLEKSPGCPHLPHRLLAICDISADPGGSIQFMTECTTINHPFELYDAEQHVEHESFSGDGVLVCSIDNMPAQLPRESTEFFGDLLMPHIHEILKSDARTPFEEFKADDVVRNAVITSNGRLTPNFEYIKDLREQKSKKMAATTAYKEINKRVLLLGAGYVSEPVVDYLTRDPKISVTISSNLKAPIDKFVRDYPRTAPALVDIAERPEEVEKLIKSHDLVISLLPYQYHPDVAKMCIKHGKNMVTASYKSPAMAELHDAAVEAEITIVNEVGVDPGIDHMLAVQCFDEVRAHGGKVVSFVSWCGGIPSPEFSNNPLRYKFNWSPRGVLLNTLSNAKYLQDGKVVEIEAGGKLMKEGLRPLKFLPGFNIEGFPNRDSLTYIDQYNIKQVHTMLRGTIRYKGFARAATILQKLGLIDPNPSPILHKSARDITWREFLCQLHGKNPTMLKASFVDFLTEYSGDEATSAILEGLGLLDDDEFIDKENSPLDTLSSYLSKKLAYEPGEKDVLIMRHDIGVVWPDKSEEMEHVDFVIYGNPQKYSAMAATVGFPAAIAAKMVLEGEIQEKGMVLPTSQDVYRPILKRLEAEGLASRDFKTIIKEKENFSGEAARY